MPLESVSSESLTYSFDAVTFDTAFTASARASATVRAGAVEAMANRCLAEASVSASRPGTAAAALVTAFSPVTGVTIPVIVPASAVIGPGVVQTACTVAAPFSSNWIPAAWQAQTWPLLSSACGAEASTAFGVPVRVRDTVE